MQESFQKLSLFLVLAKKKKFFFFFFFFFKGEFNNLEKCKFTTKEIAIISKELSEYNEN